MAVHPQEVSPCELQPARAARAVLDPERGAQPGHCPASTATLAETALAEIHPPKT